MVDDIMCQAKQLLDNNANEAFINYFKYLLFISVFF